MVIFSTSVFTIRLNSSETQLGQCADLPTQNPIIAPIFAIMELSALYQDILGKGGCHALSPQVWKLLCFQRAWIIVPSACNQNVSWIYYLIIWLIRLSDDIILVSLNWFLQVFSSLIWALTRIMSSYHMPNERDYQFIPTSVVATFGVDSPIS